MKLNRRRFLGYGTLALGTAAGLSRGTLAQQRKFRMSLNSSAIGVRTDQRGLLEMAHRHGFEAISAMPQALADMSGEELSGFLGDMNTKGIGWGAAGLPIQFRKDESEFREGLGRLPALSQALERAGVTRVGTWIMPAHADLTYLENFRQHAKRLRECARILKDHGLRLGLEYVGPRTLMVSQRFPFVHTMAETRDLIGEIGETNVGFQLDSFHWYCAGETETHLLTLRNEDVVVCDLNDARAGLPPEEQMDGKRELPSATGVIDLRTFLGALVRIGYDGPVRAEPFNQELREMDEEDALKATYQAMRKSCDLV